MLRKKIILFFMFVCFMVLFSSIFILQGIANKVYAAEVLKSGDYRYEILEDGTVSIIKYTGKATKVTFPGTLGKRKVTRIAADEYCVFEEALMNKVVSVVILEGVTVIGGNSFMACEKLKSVTLPGSLLRIEDDAFSFCRKLTEIKLPSGLEYIGNNAFSQCESLADIKLPNSLKYIGDQAFTYCTGLKEIIIPDSVTEIGYHFYNNKYFDDLKYRYGSGDLLTQERYLGGLANAFKGCDNLKKIKFPKHIKDISLMNCRTLENVTVPQGVETMVFIDCPNLKKINIPNTVTALFFIRCNSLASLDIPEGVQQIYIVDCPALAQIKLPKTILNVRLTGCSKLKSIKLPDTLTQIDARAFAGCKSLEEINIPNGVISVGEYILDDTAWYKKQKDGLVYKDKWCLSYKGNRTNIKSLTIAKGTKAVADYLITGSDSLEKIMMPDSVEIIGNQAFYGCKKLNNITLPKNLKDIGENAFADCTKLNNFTLPQNIKHIGERAFVNTGWLKNQKNGVIYKDGWVIGYKGTMPKKYSLTIKTGTIGIADDAFLQEERINGDIVRTGMKNLTSVSLPDTVRYIGKGAFADTGLVNITLPDSIERLDGTFSRCTQLKEIRIPNSVKYIGNETFMNCHNLTNIVLPDKLKEIGDYAFWKCEKLEDFVMPEGIERIGYQAFFWCDSLGNVNIPGNTITIEEEAFYACRLGTVTVISKNVKIGEHALGYMEQIPGLGGYAKAGVNISGYSGSTAEEYAKRNGLDFTPILKIELPEGTEATPLADLEYEENWLGVTITGYKGKGGDIALVIPPEKIKYKNITAIGDGAFSGCSGLTGIAIPKGVTKIGNNAFAGCSALTSVTIPEGVTEIGDNAFYGCSTLTDIRIREGVSIIDMYTFAGCSSLTDVKIPKGVRIIGEGAFWKCSGLASITMTEGVAEIQEYAFSECRALTGITIPKGVKKLGEGVFYGCSNLTAATFLGEYPAGITGVDLPSRCTVYYKKEYADSWKNYIGNKAIISSEASAAPAIAPTAPPQAPDIPPITPDIPVEVPPIPTTAPISEEQVYADIIALRADYPEGMDWTNSNYYQWNGGIYSGGYGCVAFAFLLSDAAFGDLPATKHTDFSNIRTGDIIRINNDTHSVVVLEVTDGSIVIAEGNYNSSIHWGRILNRNELFSSGGYILTRYP